MDFLVSFLFLMMKIVIIFIIFLVLILVVSSFSMIYFSQFELG